MIEISIFYLVWSYPISIDRFIDLSIGTTLVALIKSIESKIF